MSNNIDQTLQEILNDLPPRVSNRLVLAEVIEMRKTLSGRLDTLEQRVHALEEKTEPATMTLTILKVVGALILIGGASNAGEIVKALTALFGG